MKRYAGFLLLVMVGALCLAARVTAAAAEQGDNPWLLAETGWPTRQFDSQRGGASPYQGVTSGPLIRWVLAGEAGLTAAGITVGISETLYLLTAENTLVVDFEGNTLSETLPGGICSSMPTQTRNGHLFYHTTASFVHYTAEGELVWEIPFPFGCNHSTAAIDENGILYVGMQDGRYAAIDLAADEVLWNYPAHPFATGSTPALGPDGTIYITLNSLDIYRSLVALNPDGSVRWEKMRTTDASNVAVGADGTVYLAFPTLLAYTPDGELLWEYDLQAYPCARLAAPAIGPDGTIYMGTKAIGGQAFLHAVNPHGTMKWRFDVPVIAEGGDICSSPVVDRNGNVYFCADNGRCYGLAPDGRKLWEVVIRDGTWLRQSPVIARDGLMILPAGKLGTALAIEQATEGVYLPVVVRQ